MIEIADFDYAVKKILPKRVLLKRDGFFDMIGVIGGVSTLHQFGEHLLLAEVQNFEGVFVDVRLFGPLNLGFDFFDVTFECGPSCSSKRTHCTSSS